MNLETEQVRESPDADTAKPVSRQEEIAMSRHYGWPAYWSLEPLAVAASAIEEIPPPMDDPHLRSATEVRGYQVHATDADVGGSMT